MHNSMARGIHGSPSLRGMTHIPRSVSHTGRFGRIFRALPPLDAAPEDLDLLASTMIERGLDRAGEELPSDNPTIPAGYVYLGQFIDHDLTFDPSSRLQRDNDPDGLVDFRTPRFDLDSLYGAGPMLEPYFYDGDGFFRTFNEAGYVEDLMRVPAKEPGCKNEYRPAIIADIRNDQNQIISQLHLAFIRYHNRVLSAIGKGGFDQARQIVRWHYQWIVLRDYLPKIIGSDLVADILRRRVYVTTNGSSSGEHGWIWKPHLRFFAWKHEPFMPVEFSGAAFRFGHSMVRTHYSLQAGDGRPVIFGATLGAGDLRGGTALSSKRKIQWYRFFPMCVTPTDGKHGRRGLQASRAIDTLLAEPLGKLPDFVTDPPIGTSPEKLNSHSLPALNLRRGIALGLPSGQSIARAMGLPDHLILGTRHGRPFRIGVDYLNDPTVPHLEDCKRTYLERKFSSSTPLWYYILKEAEVLCQGRRLGPLGSRIVGEVIIGLLAGDPQSFLNIEPRWQPQAGQFGCNVDGEFEIRDLIQYAS